MDQNDPVELKARSERIKRGMIQAAKRQADDIREDIKEYGTEASPDQKALLHVLENISKDEVYALAVFTAYDLIVTRYSQMAHAKMIMDNLKVEPTNEANKPILNGQEITEEMLANMDIKGPKQ